MLADKSSEQHATDPLYFSNPLAMTVIGFCESEATGKHVLRLLYFNSFVVMLGLGNCWKQWKRSTTLIKELKIIYTYYKIRYAIISILIINSIQKVFYK